jgi:DNA-binding NarL/FixJ family response regulator
MSSTLSATSHSNRARLRVILVDDSPHVLQDLHLLLELPGEIEIIAEASNGQEAIRLVDTDAPDVVVMDLEMPIMNGYEATRWIKSRIPAPRVVILSVHTGLEEQEKARAAGADGFVVKGAGFEVLMNAILIK